MSIFSSYLYGHLKRLMNDKESHRRVQVILDEIGIPRSSQQDYLKMKINMTRTLAESQPDLARVQHSPACSTSARSAPTAPLARSSSLCA